MKNFNLLFLGLILTSVNVFAQEGQVISGTAPVEQPKVVVQQTQPQAQETQKEQTNDEFYADLEKEHEEKLLLEKAQEEKLMLEYYEKHPKSKRLKEMFDFKMKDLDLNKILKRLIEEKGDLEKVLKEFGINKGTFNLLLEGKYLNKERSEKIVPSCKGRGLFCGPGGKMDLERPNYLQEVK